MKLAEALIERADLQKTIEQVKNRMRENAIAQEGDEPVEAMERLFSLHEDLMLRLEGVIIRINRTNNSTAFDGNSLSDALVKRDCLKAQLKALQSLYRESMISLERRSRNEVKFVRFVDMGRLQRMIDSLSKQYRELDTRIQGLNWTVDLAE